MPRKKQERPQAGIGAVEHRAAGYAAAESSRGELQHSGAQQDTFVDDDNMQDDETYAATPNGTKRRYAAHDVCIFTALE